MEKLPRHLNVPLLHTSGVTGKLVDLSKKWEAYQNAPQKDQGRLRERFYSAAEALATWLPGRHTPRKKWGSEVIDRLDPRHAKLPGPAKQLHLQLWDGCHKCFEDAAHHKPVLPETFALKVQHLEDFLLDRLRPRTVEDQRVIQDIVREGEADA
jgi:hypothetical protein